ncbi:hypothetical protein B0O99DRAFT_600099 [Bisporella sp. PMI_857]|nr:hypothetical protein B0O99DRAFT_600099 [Bisporella sp. PMI_857]
MVDEKEAEIHTSRIRYRPTDKIRIRTIIKALKVLIFHLLACIGLSLALLYAVNDYKALDGTSTPRSSNGKFTLRSGDITSLISAAIIILNVITTIWCSTSVAQCAFAELENSGLTIAQFNRMMAWPNIPRLKVSGISGFVMIILLANFPQAYIAPLLEGSVNWGAAFEEVGEVMVASGNPAADFNLWGWYGVKLQDRKAAVRRAAGMANLAWGTTNISADSRTAQKRCRHVVNDNQLPVNSRLINITMPSIIIHSIKWPTGPEPEIVNTVADASELLTISDTTAFSFVNYPGNAVLFDQTNTTLKLPYNGGLDDDALFRPDSVYPESFKFSGVMTAIVLLGKEYDAAPYFVDGFGYLQPNNNFSTLSSFYQLDFTYLEVNFTVGVTTAPSSTYISSQVVEGTADPKVEDIVAGPWVREALYLLPDVMSMLAIMNTTSLDTWGNLFNYTENLIRYSYQGSWDMLQRNFDPNTTTLAAAIAAPRVQATVSYVRVYCWLFVNLLLTLSVFPLLWLTTKCDRSIIVDGPLSLLLTDPTELFKDSRENKYEKHHLSNLAFLSRGEKKITMQLVPDGSEGFKLTDRVDQ